MAYTINGRSTTEIPAQSSVYDQIKCIYAKMPGWRTPTQGITKFEKLPKAAREYLAFLEKESGARIGMISTGPGREQTIFVDEFADELKTLAERKTKATKNLKRSSR
jgi:adenylosuccinate synthase